MNIKRIDTVELADYEVAKQRLSYKLRPSNFVSKGITMDYLNMKVEPVIIIEKQEDHMSEIPVTIEMISAWDISREQLFNDTMENAPKIQNLRCEKIGRLIDDMITDDPGLKEEIDDFDSIAESDYDPPLFVVTNDEMFRGAGVVFYPGFLEQLTKEIGENMYIIPSSQHEVILCPESFHDYEVVHEMVKNVNSTSIGPDEYLGDYPYVYDKDIGIVACPPLHLSEPSLDSTIKANYELTKVHIKAEEIHKEKLNKLGMYKQTEKEISAPSK